jgi:diguanylate cyclase (GGDEF)-like protein/PAS domain S-box-containing protein
VLHDPAASLLDTAFAHAPVGLLVVDDAGRVLVANAAAERLLGHPLGGLAGRLVEDLLPAALRDRHRGHRDRFTAAPAARSMGEGMNLEVLRADGSALEVDIALGPLPGGRVCVALSDATEHRRHARRLRRLADEDPLTGLLNRRGMEAAIRAHLERARREEDRFALLLVDVDRFKAINDTAGHPVGDDVLRAIAAAMRGRARAGDVLGRAGGDEFIACLAGADAPQAVRFADALRGAITAAVVCDDDGRPVPITTSIGVACFPRDARDLDALIVAADARLYAAKDAGRDRVVDGG